MKNLPSVYQFLFALTIMSLSVCSGVSTNEWETGDPDKTLKKGSWELQIFYRNKGTRSEGQHGVLLYYDKPVQGTVVGEEKDTELGRMEYYGPENEKQVPWAPTGWNFADKGNIKPSWQDKDEKVRE